MSLAATEKSSLNCAVGGFAVDIRIIKIKKLDRIDEDI